MYADALEKGFYPMEFIIQQFNLQSVERSLELWNGVHPSNARALLDPRTVTGNLFHYFIALVEFRTHPLCPDHCIPFLSAKRTSLIGERVTILQRLEFGLKFLLMYIWQHKMTGGELLSVKEGHVLGELWTVCMPST